MDSLRSLDEGECLRIDSVDSAPETRLRLAELGLRRGVIVRLNQHTTGGGLIVEVDGSRVALGRELAESIHGEGTSGDA